MAFIQNFLFPSKYLATEPQVSVILPSRRLANDPGKQIWEIGKKFKTLYLLHGIGDNQTHWARFTNVEWFAEKYNIAVVMPEGNVSFYSDMVWGQKYWSYLSIELPRYMQAVFPFSEKREDNFTAGVSMGGYGAYKLALSCPEKFSAAASLSGALDVAGMLKNGGDKTSDKFSFSTDCAFGKGNDVQGTGNDLFFLLKDDLDKMKTLPRLYQNVGTEDPLYHFNQNFLHYAQSLNVPVTYEEHKGVHDWDYWQEQLPRVFRWLSHTAE